MDDKRDAAAIQKHCTRFLAYHYRHSPKQELSALADATDDALDADRYGQGKLINDFEEAASGYFPSSRPRRSLRITSSN
jgi:hypothetical protein